ncbi:MAG TPA: hypothetical protein VLA98_07450 [Solirubrobacteraceae bacterium]|nr:hypothetical protein [Solirubrobacteraceae bacterium]
MRPVLSGTRGDNGWWRSSVRLTWQITPTPDNTNGCDVHTLTQQTDANGTSFTCSAEVGGFWTTSPPVVIRIDWTPPSNVAPSAARPPDAPPWYTSPVAVAWSGTDATSGIASCTSLTYGGPDNGAATVAGSCSDRAGNASAAVPFALAFDATAPALGGVTAVAGLGQATLSWSAPPDAVQVSVARAAGARAAAPRALPAVEPGRAVDRRLAPGVRYTWVVTARDAAGNATSATASAVWRPPVLRWHRRHGARYYNVQVFRGGRKVLSAWPRRARLPLKGRWRFGGRRLELQPGRYTWYAWPGYGARAARSYGHLAARGRFTVH